MENDEFSEDDEMNRQMRLERMRLIRQEGEDEQEDAIMDGALDFEDVKGKLSLWVQRSEVIRWIRKIFGKFLRTFVDETGNHVYEGRIHDLCSMNKQSIEVTFLHLS